MRDDVEAAPAAWQLAQINIGRMVAPKGDPRVQPFFDALDRINALADATPGFVWRLQTEAGNATDILPTPDPLLLVNLSVWRDAEALFDFVYRSAHTPEMARRREYFAHFDGAYQALWWVPAGHRPGVEEGLSRLWLLDLFGPSAKAFTFKVLFRYRVVEDYHPTCSPIPGVWGAPDTQRAPRNLPRCLPLKQQQGRLDMGRSILLWLLGVPIPIIILLAIFWH